MNLTTGISCLFSTALLLSGFALKSPEGSRCRQLLIEHNVTGNCSGLATDNAEPLDFQAELQLDNGKYHLKIIPVKKEEKPTISSLFLQFCEAVAGCFLNPIIGNCSISDNMCAEFTFIKDFQREEVHYVPLSINSPGLLHFSYLLLGDGEIKNNRNFAIDTQKNHVSKIKRQAQQVYILAADRSQISRVNLDGTENSVLVEGLTNTIPIDYDYRQNSVYWSEYSQIRRSNLNGQSQTATTMISSLGNIEGIAVDWVNHKVYFTDFGLDIIGVFDPFQLVYSVLLRTDISIRLGSIVVDPATRVMYWSDWGQFGQIEKASMDGTNRTVIHDQGLSLHFALTLDIWTQTLYWADVALDKIERSHVDGSNRQLIARVGGSDPYGIALIDNLLYFSDHSDRTIKYVNISDGVTLPTSNITTFSSLLSPFGIVAVNMTKQLLTPNPCALDNGGCSHLCLLSTVDAGYSCACPEGRVLQGNSSCIPERAGSCVLAGHSGSCCTGTSCQGFPPNCYCDADCNLFRDCCTDVHQDCSNQSAAEQRYLIVADQNLLYRVSLDGERQVVLVRNLPINAVAIDYDFRRGFMYWTDISLHALLKSNLDGSATTALFSERDFEAHWIAVDWMENMIYYTTVNEQTIGVLNPDTTEHRTLIETGFASVPQAIVLDPKARVMYWTDRGTSPRIEKASMDGTNRGVLHSTRLVVPYGLVLDIETQTLYWADAQLNIVEKSAVDGSEREVVSFRGILDPFAITSDGSTLYMSDLLDRRIHSVSISGGTTTVLSYTTNFTRPTGIRVVSQELQPINSPSTSIITTASTTALTPSANQDVPVTTIASSAAGVSVLLICIIAVIIVIAVIRKSRRRNNDATFNCQPITRVQNVEMLPIVAPPPPSGITPQLHLVPSMGPVINIEPSKNINDSPPKPRKDRYVDSANFNTTDIRPRINSGFIRNMCDSEMLIPGRHIQLLDTIGQGEFGVVYRGRLSGWKGRITAELVAVKTLKGHYTEKDVEYLSKESEKMKKFHHSNILTLVGVCIDAGESPYVVMPFMANGSLLTYLRKERPNFMVAQEAGNEIVISIQKKLLSMCLQISKGMRYLSEQDFIHRDLAARNCMIDQNFIIKISDFGLSEDVFSRNYFRQAKQDENSAVRLPIKWMAPESLSDGVFTAKTDVWSYGVTCWEIFTIGHNPYPTVAPFMLLKYLKSGKRLDKPTNAACGYDVYEMMSKCWCEIPEKRPSFDDLVPECNMLLEGIAGYIDMGNPTT